MDISARPAGFASSMALVDRFLSTSPAMTGGAAHHTSSPAHQGLTASPAPPVSQTVPVHARHRHGCPLPLVDTLRSAAAHLQASTSATTPLHPGAGRPGSHPARPTAPQTILSADKTICGAAKTFPLQARPPCAIIFLFARTRRGVRVVEGAALEMR